MNIRTILIAAGTLAGTYYVGFPILYCFLAFNAVFWCEILYKRAFSTDSVPVVESGDQEEDQTPDSMQIEFEKFLIRKYLELVSAVDETPNDQTPVINDTSMVVTEP